MNYQGAYERLMARAQGRDIAGYVERHHVTPRCMGGADESWNIVALTAREHYVAHQLLVKLFPSHAGLAHAARMMTMDPWGKRPGNRRYEWLARRSRGQPRSDEVRAKLSAANKGTPNVLKGVPRLESTRRKISRANSGLKRSESAREKYSAAQLRRSVTPGITQRRNGKFVARKRINGKRVYLGFFRSLEEASEAWARA